MSEQTTLIDWIEQVQPLCSVEGCSKPACKRGWCLTHYSRWQRHKRIELLEVPSLEERFWKYVNKDGPVHPVCGQCWVWTAGKIRSGYGHLKGRGRSLKTHRYSWELHNGPIPDGLRVLHQCDNPACVNPAHLFLGTDQDNKSDSVTKGRHAKGERIGKARLTDAVVEEIRRRYRPRSKTDGARALAREKGVAAVTIWRVVAGLCWTHVG